MFKFLKKNKKIKKIKIILSDPKSRIPTKSNKFDAGFDLYASKKITIKAHSNGLVKTGIRIQLPDNFWAAICSRSGLALKKNIFVQNSPGVIDSGYRDPIGVILRNESDKDFVVNVGDRVGQMVIMKYENAELLIADNLDDSERGNNGFGSTGK